MKNRRALVLGVGSFLVFSVGVRAETSSTVVPPGLINGIADGADRSLIAHVSATGELSATDAGTRARLDILNFKLLPLSYGAGGLKVEAAGHVAIDNLPAVQQVSGSVTVANLPAQQTVSGTVSVANFPAMQPVAVANFPTTQNVSVVGGMEIAPTTNGVGEFDFRLVNDGKKESEWLAATPQCAEEGEIGGPGGSIITNGSLSGSTTCTATPFQTTRFGELLTAEEHTITLISLRVNRWIHLTCRHHGQRVLILETNAPTTREFVHPLVVDECWLSCDTLEPASLVDTAFVCEGSYAFAGP